MAKLLTVLALLWAQGTPGAQSALELAPVEGHSGFVAARLPPLPPALSARVLQYAQTRSASLCDVSPDGRQVLVAAQLGTTQQLYRVSQPLGMREQLTFFDAPVRQGAFVPGDPFTLFFLLEAAGGGGPLQLQRLDLRTGRSELLTDGKSRHEAFVFSRDGRWLAYSGTGRNGQDSDVYLAEVADARSARRLTALEGQWLPLEFSPDGTRLLLAEGAAGESPLWLLDIATGARRRLSPEAEAGAAPRVRMAHFSADGQAVYLLTDAASDFTRLRRLPLQPPGADLQAVVSDVPADVEDLAVATDGTLVFSTNEAGYSHAYLVRGRRAEALPLPEGVLRGLRFAPGKSDLLFFGLESPTSPADVWAFSLKTKKAVRWTKSEVGGIDAHGWVSPKLLRYSAADGVPLTAFLYVPRDVPTGRRVPVVLAFHDGPEAEERPAFHGDYQLLLERGLAVLAPNVRGSDGYGKAFRWRDDGVLREQVLKDVAATLAVVGRQPGLDASRVAAWGEGYGGYLALLSAAFFPDAISAAADISGMVDLPSFLEAAPAYRRDALRREYGDERMPAVRAVQERLSPLQALAGSHTPLLVVHGGRDTRLSEQQAQSLVRGGGQDGWYLLALEEGPGVWRREARALATAALALFLQEKLRGP